LRGDGLLFQAEWIVAKPVHCQEKAIQMSFCQCACCSSIRVANPARSGDAEEIRNADISGLLKMLASVPDFRKEKGKEYELSFILAVCLIAAIAGAKNYRETATVAAHIPQGMLRIIGAKWNYFTRRYEHPRKTTIWLTLTSVDAEELDAIAGEWLLSQARKHREYDGSYTWEIAIDGKVMRGAWTDENDQVTLFSAMLHREAVTIAQVRVPDGTNETTQAEALINKCAIREGETVLATLDAAHSSKETAQLIGGKKGWDYLITLKTDKPALYRKAAEKIIPVLGKPPHDIMTETRRGRTKVWSCWITSAQGTGYPHLEQVACIRREEFNANNEKISKEITLKITSATPEKMTAADANRHARNHWGIENKSHYIRDTVYREDDNQAYSGDGPQGLAALHNLALGLFRLKGARFIKETTELIHLDLTRAVQYLIT
jgi:predicted transposase YbfD/YdcC